MTEGQGRQRLSRQDAYEYEMTIREPKLTVRPGELFVVETEDAENGLIRSPGDLPDRATLGDSMSDGRSNPCAGPICVEGAGRGDLLAVTVHDIQVDGQGFSYISPDFGLLSNSRRHAECAGPYTRIIEHVEGPSGTTADGRARFTRKTSWDLQPHIGTIGTVPDRPIAAGSDTLSGQGPHGGNLDCRDVRPGHTILLPVAVDGAYLYLGDVHGSQADGEILGIADETRADVTLSCEVIPQKTIPFMRIIAPDRLIQVHHGRPLEDAISQAFEAMLDWLVEDYGFEPREAYLQLGVNPEVRIHVYQMVKLGRLTHTAGVSFPVDCLPRG